MIIAANQWKVHGPYGKLSSEVNIIFTNFLNGLISYMTFKWLLNRSKLLKVKVWQNFENILSLWSKNYWTKCSNWFRLYLVHDKTRNGNEELYLYKFCKFGESLICLLRNTRTEKVICSRLEFSNWLKAKELHFGTLNSTVFCLNYYMIPERQLYSPIQVIYIFTILIYKQICKHVFRTSFKTR